MRIIPIFFKPELVKANLDDRKTQTRRTRGLDHVNNNPDEWELHSYEINRKGKFCAVFSNRSHPGLKQVAVSPYGQPGDVLWVRETWMNLNIDFPDRDPIYVYNADLLYGNDYGPIIWKPNMHMPKDACRMFLLNKSVRAERLQDITEEDAIAEGIEATGAMSLFNRFYRNYLKVGYMDLKPIASFKSLWQSINGHESWDANPWVWVVEFERTEKPANWPC